MMRKTQRILLMGAILGAAVLLSLLLSTMRKAPPKKDIVETAMLVEVVELESVTAQFSIHSQGTVRPRTETILSAEVSGAIVEMSPKFAAGRLFQPGEVLLRIDPTDYGVAVKQAEALVKQRQIEFDGAAKLRSRGYRAESEYASAVAALASAEAELVRAQRNLERTYIRLPYEGMVRSKDADLGQFVSPGTRLGITFATDYAEVRLPLTDRDLAFIHLPAAADIADTGEANGPPVTLAATQRGQLTQWTARIVRSEGVVDESSRVTYAVARIGDPYRLREAGNPVPMGTFVSATIEGGSNTSLFRVPRHALRGSDQLLFVDDESKLRIRNVNIVRADSNYAYFDSGASPGERVIVTTIESPINGIAVRTTDNAEPVHEAADEQIASKVEE